MNESEKFDKQAVEYLEAFKLTQTPYMLKQMYQLASCVFFAFGSIMRKLEDIEKANRKNHIGMG